VTYGQVTYVPLTWRALIMQHGLAEGQAKHASSEIRCRRVQQRTLVEGRAGVDGKSVVLLDGHHLKGVVRGARAKEQLNSEALGALHWNSENSATHHSSAQLPFKSPQGFTNTSFTQLDNYILAHLMAGFSQTAELLKDHGISCQLDLVLYQPAFKLPYLKPSL
jgi:hypothetical protein